MRKFKNLSVFLFSVLLIGCLAVVLVINSGRVRGDSHPDETPEEIAFPDNDTAPENSVSLTENFQNNPVSEKTEDTDTPWYLALVNRNNPLPEDYAEQELDLVDVPGGEKVDARIYDPLMEMLDAAEETGPIVVSGYRTADRQQRMYDDMIKKYRKQGYSESEAAQLAQQWVAEPGTSEHQLGLAVDINGATYDVYLWLQENSYKYGFIFRYPGNKTHITGVAEEVWHYRYVGKEAAAEIYERGICLEEYLEDLQGQASGDPPPQEQGVPEVSVQDDTSRKQAALHKYLTPVPGSFLFQGRVSMLSGTIVSSYKILYSSDVTISVPKSNSKKR